MTYTLAQAYDAQELVNLVNQLIGQGYEPHGSLSVILLHSMGVVAKPTCVYVQAMLKRSEKGDEA